MTLEEQMEGPLVFDEIEYEPGGIYDFDQLPFQAQGDAAVQFEDSEDAARQHTYRFYLLPPYNVRQWAENMMGPLNKMFRSPKIRRLERSILKKGLKSPPIGAEGGHRAVVFAKLGLPMPYFSIYEEEKTYEGPPLPIA